jgi:hypothetical protein
MNRRDWDISHVSGQARTYRLVDCADHAAKRNDLDDTVNAATAIVDRPSNGDNGLAFQGPLNVRRCQSQDFPNARLRRCIKMPANRSAQSPGTHLLVKLDQ